MPRKNGYGSVMQKDWMAGYLDTNLLSHGLENGNSEHCHWLNEDTENCFNINMAELLPVWQAVKRHSSDWCNKQVIYHTDITQVKWAINRGRSINKSNMKLLREIFWESNFLPDLSIRLHCYNDVSKLIGFGLCCLAR